MRGKGIQEAPLILCGKPRAPTRRFLRVRGSWLLRELRRQDSNLRPDG
jgi:hypothetical protein